MNLWQRRRPNVFLLVKNEHTIMREDGVYVSVVVMNEKISLLAGVFVIRIKDIWVSLKSGQTIETDRHCKSEENNPLCDMAARVWT